MSDSKQSAKEKEIEKSSCKLISSLLSQPMKISKSLHPKLKFMLPIVLSLTFFFFFKILYIHTKQTIIYCDDSQMYSFIPDYSLSMDTIAY